jgi:hypothetical protein
MRKIISRHTQSTEIGNNERTPNEISEAHLSLVLALMEQEYQENGLDGLKESSWTNLLITHAQTKGMKVDKATLVANISAREQTKKKGNFFTDLSEALTVMRTGIMQDKNVRVLDGYIA